MSSISAGGWYYASEKSVLFSLCITWFKLSKQEISTSFLHASLKNPWKTHYTNINFSLQHNSIDSLKVHKNGATKKPRKHFGNTILVASFRRKLVANLVIGSWQIKHTKAARSIPSLKSIFIQQWTKDFKMKFGYLLNKLRLSQNRSEKL